jgi:hypothetical protein
VARARLASQVLRRLRRAGVRNARYDWRSFSVQFTPTGQDVPTVLQLDGLLADRSGRRRDRRARRRQFVDGFLRSARVPTAWDQACPMLRPVLRGVTTVAAGVNGPLRRPALPFLAEFVVVDQPDTMTYVSADQLTAWGVSADEVFGAARANLAGAELRGVAQGPTVVRFVDDGDSYWTSHLLLDGWLGRLAGQVGGVPVAFAPERGTLLVTADGGEHLTALFAQAEAVYLGSVRPISPMAYTAGARGRTVPYRAPAEHPLHRRVQRAEALLAATECNRQAVLLEQTDAFSPAGHAETPARADVLGEDDDSGPTGRASPVGDAAPSDGWASAVRASLATVEIAGSDGEGWRTRTAWSGDETALLAQTDEVVVGDRVLAWADVDAAVVAGFDPPRYRVSIRP